MRNELRLQEVYEGLFDGPHATPKPCDQGPVFLGIKNITEDGRLDFNNIRHISEDEYARWTKRVIPKEGDIVFSYEATLHRYAIIPKGFRGCLGRRMALIRPNNEKVNTKYLFYYFFSDEWRQEVSKNILTGSTVDRIPLTKVPEFKINLPSKKHQDSVANIITSYDDLIENNNRRIAIFEEMARSLYREWFVKFRFSGHETTKMVESELGQIPEGWRVIRLFDIASPTYGYAFKSSLFNDTGDGTPVVRIRDILKDVSNTFTPEHPKKEEQILKNGDLLIGMDGDFHMGKWAGGHAYLNQRVVKITPNEMYSPYFLFLVMQKPIKELNTSIVGTTVAHLGDSHLKEIKVIVPDELMLLKINGILDSIFKQEINLKVRNKNLKTQRDMILPKLISGKIEV